MKNKPIKSMAIWSLGTPGFLQKKVVPKAAGGKMQAGASMDKATGLGSRIAFNPNVSKSMKVTQIIHERMILAVRCHERSWKRRRSPPFSRMSRVRPLRSCSTSPIGRGVDAFCWIFKAMPGLLAETSFLCSSISNHQGRCFVRDIEQSILPTS